MTRPQKCQSARLWSWDWDMHLTAWTSKRSASESLTDATHRRLFYSPVASSAGAWWVRFAVKLDFSSELFSVKWCHVTCDADIGSSWQTLSGTGKKKHRGVNWCRVLHSRHAGGPWRGHLANNTDESVLHGQQSLARSVARCPDGPSDCRRWRLLPVYFCQTVYGLESPWVVNVIYCCVLRIYFECTVGLARYVTHSSSQCRVRPDGKQLSCTVNDNCCVPNEFTFAQFIDALAMRNCISLIDNISKQHRSLSPYPASKQIHAMCVYTPFNKNENVALVSTCLQFTARKLE